jgi:hypothetical protein
MTGYDLFKICCFNKAFAIEDYLTINFMILLKIHIFIMENKFYALSQKLKLRCCAALIHQVPVSNKKYCL